MLRGIPFFLRKLCTIVMLAPLSFSWGFQASGDTAEWGQAVRGVLRRFVPDGKEIALTFDACGGARGAAVDWQLIDLLRTEEVPATLFLSGEWIEKNEETTRMLASDPLFEIANHGMRHRPLSVSGQSAYGIPGTKSPDEARREVEENARLIEDITGRRPRFFRSGTNHYDEPSVRIAESLGHRTIGCTINGDAGATASKDQIVRTLLAAKGGEVILFHMNRPDGATFEGLREALPLLRERGFRFTLLSGRSLLP